MSYAEKYKKLWKEEEQEQSRVWDRQLNPWETVLGKAYLRIVGGVENALEMNRQGAFMAADLVLQRGLLAAEKILTEANHPLDAYLDEKIAFDEAEYDLDIDCLDT